MSYSEYTWQTGETITAEKLNNLEEGIQDALDCCGGASESDVFYVTVSFDGSSFVADKTNAEIWDAVTQDKSVKLKISMGEGYQIMDLFGVDSANAIFNRVVAYGSNSAMSTIEFIEFNINNNVISNNVYRHTF